MHRERSGRGNRSGSWPGRALLTAVLLTGALLTAGCAGLTSTLGALSSDGFDAPNVAVNSSSTSTSASYTVVTVRSPHHRTLPDDAAVTRAAELVWRTTTVRVDEVQATVGDRAGDFDRARMTALFGSRDPGLDAQSAGSEITGVLAWVAGTALAMSAMVGVLIVVLVRRSRRRAATASPGGPSPWAGPAPWSSAPRPPFPWPGAPAPPPREPPPEPEPESDPRGWQTPPL